MCSTFIKICFLQLIDFVLYFEDPEVMVDITVYDVPRCGNNRSQYFRLQTSRSSKLCTISPDRLYRCFIYQHCEFQRQLSKICWTAIAGFWILSWLGSMCFFPSKPSKLGTDMPLNLTGWHVHFFNAKVMWIHFVSFSKPTIAHLILNVSRCNTRIGMCAEYRSVVSEGRNKETHVCGTRTLLWGS